MEWTSGRKLSLIVAGVNILIATGGIVVRHGQIAGALFSLYFLVWSLSFIWFPERVQSFAIFLRRYFTIGWVLVEPSDIDPSVFSFIGWVFLVTAVPVAAIVIP